MTIIGNSTSDLLFELDEYWKAGNPISKDETRDYTDIKPICEDIDEYARKVLEKDKKAFIIGKK